MRSLPRPNLGALAILVSIGAVVFLVLRPPALVGAEGVLIVLVVAAAIALITAWTVVTLQGRDAISDPEFERVVERSEQLADHAEPAPAPSDEFEAIVAEAIDRLPPEFRSVLDDVPVVVSRRGRREGAYGHYHGDTVARDDFEDRIVLYQDTLERDFGHDFGALAAEIERTLRHELAHHLGWAERGVRDLGL